MDESDVMHRYWLIDGVGKRQLVKKDALILMVNSQEYEYFWLDTDCYISKKQNKED